MSKVDTIKNIDLSGNKIQATILVLVVIIGIGLANQYLGTDIDYEEVFKIIDKIETSWNPTVYAWTGETSYLVSSVDGTSLTYYYSLNCTTGKVDFYSTNITLVEYTTLEYLNGVGGYILLKDIAFDYDLVIPENVTVTERNNGLDRTFINSANSQGSPYTISVDTVQTGYYLAQDCMGRFIDEFTSTVGTTFIQSVIDATNGGKIFVKNGQYLTDQITVTHPLVLEGESLNAIIIRPDTYEGNVPVIKVGNTTNVHISTLRVQDTVDPAHDWRASNAIQFYNVTESSIIGVHALGGNYPIGVDGIDANNWSENILIKNNIAEYSMDDCIAVSRYSRNITIENNIARNAKEHPLFGNSGIEVDDTVQGITISNNRVYNNANYGIDVHFHPVEVWTGEVENRDIIITGNIVTSIGYSSAETTQLQGISVGAPGYNRLQAYNVKISDNIVYGSIKALPVQDASIIGNTVYMPSHSTVAAIQVGHTNSSADQTRNIMIANNRVIHSGSAGQGIMVAIYATEVSVENNDITGGRPAISVYSSLSKVTENNIKNDLAADIWPYGSISVFASGTQVKDNIITDDRGTPKNRGILIKNANNVTVEGNIINGGSYGIWTDTLADNVIIKNNNLSNLLTSLGAITIQESDAPTSCIIEGNYIQNITHGTDYPRGIRVYDGNKVTVRGNVIGSCRSNVGLLLTNSVTSAWVYDNTLLTGSFVLGTASTVKVNNNQGYNPIGYLANPFTSNSQIMYDSGDNATISSDRTYTIADSDKILYVSGGTVTAITVNGQATGLTSGTFELPYASTFSITFSSAPTLKVMVK